MRVIVGALCPVVMTVLMNMFVRMLAAVLVLVRMTGRGVLMVVRIAVRV